MHKSEVFHFVLVCLDGAQRKGSHFYNKPTEYLDYFNRLRDFAMRSEVDIKQSMAAETWDDLSTGGRVHDWFFNVK